MLAANNLFFFLVCAFTGNKLQLKPTPPLSIKNAYLQKKH